MAIVNTVETPPCCLYINGRSRNLPNEHNWSPLVDRRARSFARKQHLLLTATVALNIIVDNNYTNNYEQFGGTVNNKEA